MARTEVTVAQYRRCLRAKRCERPVVAEGCNWGRPHREQHPVNCVSWPQARAFARWADGRLPTEAEWEYAARSRGQPWTFPWGNQPANCTRLVKGDGGNGCGKNRTWRVCSKPAGHSRQGLCDLAGNIEEWVADWYDPGYYSRSPRENPAGPASGKARVIRGGSWHSLGLDVRCAIRYRLDPTKADSKAVGFRCASNPQ